MGHIVNIVNVQKIHISLSHTKCCAYIHYSIGQCNVANSNLLHSGLQMAARSKWLKDV